MPRWYYCCYYCYCSLCGQTVANPALLNDHEALCRLRAEAKDKCALFNIELRRSCGQLHTEMQVRLLHYYKYVLYAAANMRLTL
jgi:hypothetical protein